MFFKLRKSPLILRNNLNVIFYYFFIFSSFLSFHYVQRFSKFVFFSIILFYLSFLLTLKFSFISSLLIFLLEVFILMLKGVFAKNERGYRLTAKNKRFWSLLILLLSVASISRKLLKTTHTEERIVFTNSESCNIQQFKNLFNSKQII